MGWLIGQPITYLSFLDPTKLAEHWYPTCQEPEGDGQDNYEECKKNPNPSF